MVENVLPTHHGESIGKYPLVNRVKHAVFEGTQKILLNIQGASKVLVGLSEAVLSLRVTS